MHVFALGSGGWAESGAPVALGHGTSANGLFSNLPGFGSAVAPEAASLALTADGSKLVVADYENDSISVVDAGSRTKTGELDLRPGKIDASQAGVPGGEFPFGVAVQGNGVAYVSSVRDREVVVVVISGAPEVVARVPVQGNPNRMLLDRAQTRLFVATDNADTVDVIDTGTYQVVHRIKTTAPGGLLWGRTPVGSTPNSLALSPDERTLYVTNAGTNAVAVIEIDDEGRGRVVGRP